MRRADRLFRIVQLLRSGRLQTARNLAEKLQVSHRTIYRDVQDLQLSGVPITGEAGVGYTLRRDFDIPPLMFDREEIAALVLGARMVQAWGACSSQRPPIAPFARLKLSCLLICASALTTSCFMLRASALLQKYAPDLMFFMQPHRNGVLSSSPTHAKTVSAACAVCILWRFISGAAPGHWPRGVSCATTSAAFA